MKKNFDKKANILKLRDSNILCIGDIMLDKFVYGEVERISPEAPVPVLRIKHEEMMLGGVGNVVRNIAAFEAKPYCISIVGDDDDGIKVKTILSSYTNDETSIITLKDRQTTLKQRFVANNQQLLRTDFETIKNIDEKIEQQIIEKISSIIKKFNAIAISDYGKGLITASFVSKVINLANENNIKTIVDPKGTDYSCYKNAFLITPNKKELHEATKMPVSSHEEIIAAAKNLLETCNIKNVLVTRSHEGMTLVTNDEKVYHFPTVAKEVYDVSGAGDTVVAAMSSCLASNIDITEAVYIANLAGGIVVGKVGTAVAYSHELIEATNNDFEKSSPFYKTMKLNEALEKIKIWRRQGKKIGFTNGCFDLIHPGHISLIEQAKAECDYLILGLNSDASVARLKGETRPIQKEDARALILSSLASVSLVIIFDEDTPLNLINAIVPDVLIKGADYTVETVVGSDVVLKNGGKVVLADLEKGFSTTNTIKKLQS